MKKVFLLLLLVPLGSSSSQNNTYEILDRMKSGIYMVKAPSRSFDLDVNYNIKGIYTWPIKLTESSSPIIIPLFGKSEYDYIFEPYDSYNYPSGVQDDYMESWDYTESDYSY